MKAVVKIGGKQFVAEKETLLVDLLPEGTKELTLDALLALMVTKPLSARQR